jgi:glycolate oxidase iron-sulfur subunit
VHYTRLLDIGREVVESKVPRKGSDALMRSALKNLLPRPALFGAAMKLGQSVRLLLPGVLRAKVPPLTSAGPAPQGGHARKLIALAGCAQPSMFPNINGATRRVLDRLGIEMVEVPGAGCCGAVRLHLHEAEGARDDARRNIDAWWPLLESGAEGLVMTASGCGSHVLDYAHLLQDDPDYALKAARVVLATRDISEVVTAEAAGLAPLLQACKPLPEAQRVLAFHSPCSLQHGLKIRGTVESLLASAGFTLTAVADSHLCCGSSGTYSVLQPELSQRLLGNKLAALTAGGPAAIASANVGCIGHMQGGTRLPVKHWIEVLDERLSA